MTQEEKEKNFELFIKKVGQCGVNTDKLVEKYGDALREASFTNMNDNGNAYPGSLINIVLKKLTPYAVRLNELLPDFQKTDKTTLVKVCLLHHIGKAIKLIPNDNQWEVEKRLMVYKYNNELPSIRTGLMSLSMLNECGIYLTKEEIEALTINDRDLTDDQSRFFASTMASIVRMANELTYIEINGK
jgi:hypothetical protein